MSPSEIWNRDLPLVPNSGRVMIEASAGTGKTYSLTTLAGRLLLEGGFRPSELLMVTFTRAAAAELRGRLGERLRQVAVDLNGDSGAWREDDVRDGLLRSVDGDVELAASTVTQALGGVDALAVGTIHSFCQMVLASGPATRAPVGTIAPAIHEIVDECISDVIVRCSLGIDTSIGARRAGRSVEKCWAEVADLMASSGAEVIPSMTVLRDGAMAIRSSPNAAVYPEFDPARGTPEGRAIAALSKIIAAEVERRCEQMRIVDFDRLQQAALDLVAGDENVRAGLQARFRGALIDEFQDTDDTQWRLFGTLFGSPSHLLVTVGDPKQAIYSFRGGDIHTYLAARSAEGVTRRELTVNWRSDPDLLAGLNSVFADFVFGSADIAYVPVAAASEEPSPFDCPVEIRCTAESADAPSTERMLRTDLPNRVIELLDSGIELPDGPVTPRAICVLTRSNRDATTVVHSLREAGIPAILGRSNLVTESPSLGTWKHLAWVLARPTDVRRVRGLMLSPWVQMSTEEVANLTDEELTYWQRHVSDWAVTLKGSGAGALFEAVRHVCDLDARLLGRPGGDRQLTDLAHIAELLVSGAERGGLSADELLTRLAELGQLNEEESEHVKGRSEGDESSVRVMTVHASKGLEFPITLVPYLWRGTSLDPVRTYYDDNTKARVIDVEISRTRAPISAVSTPRREAASAELKAESLRLAYVAMTRAKHLCVLWWPSNKRCLSSPLGSILFRERGGWAVPSAIENHAEWLRSAGLGPKVAIVTIPEAAQRRVWAPPAQSEDDQARLWASEVFRNPDRTDARWSFSSIARHAHGESAAGTVGGVAGPAEARSDDPVSIGDEGLATAGAQLVAVSSGMADAPMFQPVFPPMFPPGWAGTSFGTFIHSVFEHIEFDRPDAGLAIDRALAELGSTVHLGGEGSGEQTADDPLVRSALSVALSGILRSPLGEPGLGDSGLGVGSLSAIGRRDRLDELEFELGLPTAGATVTLAEVAALIRPAFVGHPLQAWTERLGDMGGTIELGGYLNGSIDLVARTGGGDSPRRFHVIDYKTNLLGSAAEGLEPYGPDRLWDAMAEHDYPLQAILYSVALHRFLRQRLAGYEPHVNLGNVGYLFVRGMNPAAAPPGAGGAWGVCTFPIPVAEILALSRRFADA